MDNDDKRKEFSVTESIGGKMILRVKTYETYPSTGEWLDARSCDLPEFFRRVNLKEKA